MKKSLLIAIFAIFLSLSQAYSLGSFWYSSIAIDPTGHMLDNQSVNVRISIMQGASTLYTETQSGILTDQFGCFSVNVGASLPGAFTAINADENTMMKIEVQLGAGTWVITSGQAFAIQGSGSNVNNSLPVTYTGSSAVPILSITNTGSSSSSEFKINNAGNVSPIVNLSGNGIGNGISIALTNASNGSRGLDVTQSGVGPGVFATSAGGNAVWGITSSISAAGVIGDNTYGEAVVGRNRGGNGVGAVVGRNDSSGYGVRGFNTKDGIGVLGQAGISGGTGVGGRFENVNAANTSDVLQVATNGIGNGISVSLSNASNGGRGISVTQSGVGPGVFATSAGGNAVWGITSSISAAGVIGDNTFGEAVVGRNRGGNGVGAVVGRNDSSGYGVRGFNTKDGIGVLGQAGISGGTGVGGRFENVNAANSNDALQGITNGGGNALYARSTSGNLAVFANGSGNQARIDNTGKGYFNGGTQTGGADVAEAFEVVGDMSSYEPGDVLAFSPDGDRKVMKSNKPYSQLVSGVYATKPGVLLTERDATGNLDDMVPMGVVGIIPTKVCGENGAIKIGDLLVTSSQAGVAMKGNPKKIKFGTIIGKAIQSFDGNGNGIIKVLVTVK